MFSPILSPYGGGYIRETLDDEFSLKEICTWFYVNEVIRNQKPTCHYLFPRLHHRLCFVHCDGRESNPGRLLGRQS